MTPYNLQLQKKKDMFAKTQVVVISTPSPEEVKEEMMEQDMENDMLEHYEIKPIETVDEFISTLLAARTTLHLYHFSATGLGSFASHEALSEAYTNLLPLTDSLAESVQAEKMLELSVPCSKICCDSLSYTCDLLQWVREYRKLFLYSFQQNSIDEIESVLTKLKYKLTNLK